MNLIGHSNSNLYLHKGRVRKESSYLKRCSVPDFNNRKNFLLLLNTLFPHMPRMEFIGDRIMEMNFIEGNEDFTQINFGRFGEIVYQLHSLKIAGPPKDTNIMWLLELATENLKRIGREGDIDLYALFDGLQDNAVVHGEITQIIRNKNGELFIIDWDECGIGNRYQDLGFIYYRILEKGLALSHYDAFLRGYADGSVDESVVRSVAGLVSLAYASFYDFDRRMELGKKLLI